MRFIGKFLVLGVVLILLFSFVKFKQKPSFSEDYKLVWADEFNTNGRPDEKNWNYETGFVRNQENQWYQKRKCYLQRWFFDYRSQKRKKSQSRFYI
jgi:hypothetical protein